MKSFLLKILKTILKILAKLTIRRYRPQIVGITGSVGKTSAKEATRAVLLGFKRVRSSPKSFNNELGLPLNILGDWRKTGGLFFWFEVILSSIMQLTIKNQDYPEVLILEYGVDRPGDMSYLLSIARPHIGVFTAVGEVPVHVEFFNGPEGVVREKTKLISQLPATGFAVLNADDAAVLSVKAQTRAHVVTFGFFSGADMRIGNFNNSFENGLGGADFKLTYGGSFVPVHLNGSLGRVRAYSSAIAAVIGLIFGMNLVKLAEALKHYESPAGRLKLIPGIKESIIIDDTYNASPIAMKEALETFKNIKAKRKIAVLGDMLEIGKYTLQAHEEIGKMAAKIVDFLIVVGIRGKFISESAIRAGFPKKSISVFMSVRDAGLFLQSKIERGDVILIKGSQGVRLEKVVKDVMAEPQDAEKLLVRQNKEWLSKSGLYE
ncbi:MAG: Mur ligase family protein [Patescibacteria group bacterium]|nr:Mur ligase family protein [Patescibacteria group bacterium]